MNIPNPVAVKNMVESRKAREAELASDLSSASKMKYMPSTKGSSQKNSEKSDAPNSTRSVLSPKGKVSSGRSSNMTPKKKEFSTKDSGTGKNVTVAKKPFVRPDHLTQRPLQDNEALIELRSRLNHPARGQFKREYHTSARQSGKSLIGKKENN